jgi:hypothetical protein
MKAAYEISTPLEVCTSPMIAPRPIPIDAR